MHSFKIGASMALLASLVVAAPKYAVNKRATGPSYDDPGFQSAIVDTHNAHRKYHQVGDLEWDDTLASYANEAANKCAMDHTGGPYGENLFAIYPGYDDWNSGTVDAVKSWVYEVKNYNYNKPGFNMDTGHFTQSVWKGTDKIGCSWNTVACDGAAYLFCEFSSPGNVLNAFADNVLRPGW